MKWPQRAGEIFGFNSCVHGADMMFGAIKPYETILFQIRADFKKKNVGNIYQSDPCVYDLLQSVPW
jgi:hypothetical protein